jgi:hypothetical protein
MTRPRRLLLAAASAAWVGIILACGGGGNKTEPPRFGLTEDQRKQVHRDYWEATNRVADEADEMFGVDTRPLVVRTEDQIAHFRRVAKDRGDYYLATSNRYLDEVAAKHGITREQLTACSAEGDDKRWPVPSRKGPGSGGTRQPGPPQRQPGAGPEPKPEPPDAPTSPGNGGGRPTAEAKPAPRPTPTPAPSPPTVWSPPEKEDPFFSAVPKTGAAAYDVSP